MPVKEGLERTRGGCGMRLAPRERRLSNRAEQSIRQGKVDHQDEMSRKKQGKGGYREEE